MYLPEAVEEGNTMSTGEFLSTYRIEGWVPDADKSSGKERQCPRVYEKN